MHDVRGQPVVDQTRLDGDSLTMLTITGVDEIFSAN
jgi:hypothetical protein